MRARKRFGQHFLEPPWVDKLVKAIGPAAEDRFIEVGPGPGALTRALAPHVASILAVEIDRNLATSLARHAPPNVIVVQGDFLDTPLATLRAAAPETPGGKLRVVGNLPYNISSPILFRLLEHDRDQRPYRDAILMLQREVAARLVARPGTRDYGVLTIALALQAAVTHLLAVPPGAFRPAPAVHSAVVRLSFRPSDVPVADAGMLLKMVRVMFSQRRKTVLNALRPFAGPTLGAAEALARAGIDSTCRPETLDLAALARLSDLFASAKG